MKAQSEYVKRWRLANPEKYAEQKRRNNAKRNAPANARRNCDIQLRQRYGISLEDYNTMFLNQNGLCLGCYRHQSQFKQAFSVDHSHDTKKVRGLLCHQCNFILGLAKENTQTLERLIHYLRGN